MAIDPTEAEIVRLIYLWYIEEHLSLRMVSIPRIVSDSDREAADQIREYNSLIAQRNRKRIASFAA